jgi:hypothetical protein
MSIFLKTNKAGPLTSRKLLLVVCDLIFIFISMAAAYVIRSRFVSFIFTDLYLVYCLPYVFLFRIIVNLVFDFYSLDLRFITIRDILKMYLINIIPTLGYSLIRLFSPIEVLRIPFSIIFAEYFFTVLFISISRLIMNSFMKRRNRNDHAFRYRKNALLLLNLNFTDQSLSSLVKDNQLSVIGILTENRLLWGSELLNVRVIGGWQELKNMIINHNHNLFVIIDDALEEKDKLRLYAETIDWGGSPAILSDGRLHFPSMTDLFEKRKKFNDFIPVEIESWLKTQSFTIIGNTWGQYSNLALFLQTLSRPFEVKSDFSGTPPSAGSLVIDCRLMALYESGQSTHTLINSIIDSYRSFIDSAPWADCLLVAPSRASFPGLVEIPSRTRLSLLFLNDYFQTDHQFSLYAATAQFFDRAPEILAAVFKALYCNREKKSRFYAFASLNRIDFRIFSADLRFSFLMPLTSAGVASPAPDNPSLIAVTKPTAFTGLTCFDEGKHNNGNTV